MGTIKIHPSDNVAVDVETGHKVALTDIAEGENVEIYNVLGGLVANFKYDGREINVDNLPAGMYVLKCNGMTTKFVKE